MTEPTSVVDPAPATADPDTATSADHLLPRAGTQDGTYPRPQLLRPQWADLCGTWDFADDPDDHGLAEGWFGPTTRPDRFDRRIRVPYPPESAASGVGDPWLHVVWYRRLLTAADLARAGDGTQGDTLILHLGAVDHRADVWLDGTYLGRHDGGQTPFSFDVTAVVRAAQRTPGRLEEGLPLVVRAQDDPHDVVQPRGKQDWRPEPHVIWYHRTTGIWQPVWLEAVPRLHLSELAWQADVTDGSVLLTARLSERPRERVHLDVRLDVGDELLAEHRVRVLDRDVRVRLDLPRQANGQQYEEILWSPDRPVLVDATVRLVTDPPVGGVGDRSDQDEPYRGDSHTDRTRHDETHGHGTRRDDAVASYLGLRSVAVAHGALLLNDRPFYLRSVLEQGYWPQTLLAAPDAEALRTEVQLIKDLGFNSARVHQKAEDPRFLYWADRLGLTIWAETANAYAFSPRSVELLTREWLELVRRDRSHPSIIAWVPLNESWGVQHAAHDVAQQHYGLALAHLTRALDPTRPVISNDGWEHTDSDIWTIHDYSEHGSQLRERYGSPEAVRAALDGFGPTGRRIRLSDAAPTVDRGQPVMLTEFGGISYDSGRTDAWGYSAASDDADFEARVGDLLSAVRECRTLAGFCWTQLTDTGQETNGLLRADRSPKLPTEVIRRLVTGA